MLSLMIHLGHLGYDDERIDIMEHSDKYPVMKGTGGLRKARIALDDNNKGKSGGARVLLC